MSITDELRKWISTVTWLDDGTTHSHTNILAIADRIDAEHERQMAERRRGCVFYDAERNYCKVHDEGDMAELGYVRLPVDADGVPIHAGDVLDGYGKTIEVVEMRHGRSGWVIISRDGNAYADTFAFTHYHAPTVEDVLREFGDWYAHTKGGCDEDGIIAEYAAKLRLAGENA